MDFSNSSELHGSLETHLEGQLHKDAQGWPVGDSGVRLEPVYQIAFPNGKWWSLPRVYSLGVRAQRILGFDVVNFCWDWGDTRDGGFSLVLALKTCSSDG